MSGYRVGVFLLLASLILMMNNVRGDEYYSDSGFCEKPNFLIVETSFTMELLSVLRRLDAGDVDGAKVRLEDFLDSHLQIVEQIMETSSDADKKLAEKVIRLVEDRRVGMK